MFKEWWIFIHKWRHFAIKLLYACTRVSAYTFGTQFFNAQRTTHNNLQKVSWVTQMA